MDSERLITTDQMPGSKSLRTAPKFERLISRASALMAERGFSQTSIRDVAQATDLSLGGLYYYFKNKEDLLFLIQDLTFSSLLELQETALGAEVDPRRRLDLMIRNHLEYFTTHFNELKVCTYELETLKGERFEIIGRLRKRYFHCLAKVIADLRGMPEHDALTDPGIRRQALFIFGMLNWIFMWYDPTRDGGTDVLCRDMIDLVMNGLTTNRQDTPPARGQNEG